MRDELLKTLSEITPDERLFQEGLARSNLDPVHVSRLSQVTVLPEGQSMGLYRHERFIPCPRHRHDFFELVYMCSGQTRHHVDDFDVTLKSGEILLLNQRIAHAVDEAAARDVALNLIISPRAMSSMLSAVNQNNSLFQFFLDSMRGGVQPGYFHFPVAEDPAIQNTMESLILAMLDKDGDRRGIQRLLAETLFVQLLNFEDTHKTARENPGYEQALLARALEYMDANLAQAQLSELAASVDVPLYYYSRLISKLAGESFKQLLTERRLTQAARVLEAGDASVLEAAAQVGYANISHFYRLFAARFGMAPGAYRARWKSGRGEPVSANTDILATNPVIVPGHRFC